jgi:hypothetical protein
MPKHQAPRSWRVRYCQREPARAGAASCRGCRNLTREEARRGERAGDRHSSAVNKKQGLQTGSRGGGGAAELNTAGTARGTAGVRFT